MVAIAALGVPINSAIIQFNWLVEQVRRHRPRLVIQGDIGWRFGKPGPLSRAGGASQPAGFAEPDLVPLHAREARWALLPLLSHKLEIGKVT